MTRRAAVIGCGFIGAGPSLPGAGVQSHAAAWIQHPGTELVAIAESDPERLEATARRWNIEAAFQDYREMLTQARPEIVSVATPDETHAEILTAVLRTESVRAVLAEKPLTLDPGSAARLVELAAERGIVLAVNYVRRFAPSHRAMKKWLDRGPLGRIELVRGCYCRGIKHNGTHWFDLARYLVGEITAVDGRGEVPLGAKDATIDVELEFVNGARGVLHGLRDVDYSIFEMDLIGTAGRARLVDGGFRFETQATVPSRRFPGFRGSATSQGPIGGLSDLLMHAASDLIEALSTARPPACTGEDAVEALRLAAEALESAEKGSAYVRS